MVKGLMPGSTLSLLEATWYSHMISIQQTNMRWLWPNQAMPGANEFGCKLTPPPRMDRLAHFVELARLTRFESRNTTITVMSSWKCRRTPRSIFFKSEYLISLFFAASCSAAFTNLLALPCNEIVQMKVDTSSSLSLGGREFLHYVDGFGQYQQLPDY